MAYFYVCPNCGSNLDPGEKCDCQNEKQEHETAARRNARRNQTARNTEYQYKEKESVSIAV